MADTTERLQEAIAAARGGRLAEARSIAEELTESDPQNAHAWFLRGILSEDEQQQRAYLSRTLELDPEHKAARKRMEQMGPAAEEEEAGAPEVEEAAAAGEEVEAEAPMGAAEPEEDATMVADSAAFMAAVGLAGSEDMAAEESQEEASAQEGAEAGAQEGEEAVKEPAGDTFEDTMIARSPFAEEMAAEDLQMEALFGEAVTAEDEEEGEDEGLATVIAAADFIDEEEAAAGAEAGPEAEEADEVAELKASDLAEAAADATLLDEAGEAWFEEEAGEDLWAKVEAEAVPDWLIEDTTAEAEATLAKDSLDDTFPAAKSEITREQELPDWLLEEPDEDWSEAVEATENYDEGLATVFEPTPRMEEPVEEVAPALLDEEPAPAQPKKESSTRGLELLLALLIVVAVLLVVAIAYFLINPPSF
jgi:pilus assembly protein FimV